MKLKHLMLAALMCVVGISASADEGMWLPQYLMKDHAKALKKAGLKIPVSEIYNESKSSLAVAVLVRLSRPMACCSLTTTVATRRFNNSRVSAITTSKMVLLL